jgi:DNA mismatch repair protein MutS2
VSFTPGDHVHVTGLGKGIVRASRNGGRYLVELKGRTVILSESQLTKHDEPKRKRGRAEATATTEHEHAAVRSDAPVSIDLHGMTASDALEAVDAFLNDAILASLDEVRIVHGRSGGTLRMIVHKRLKELSSVRAFRLDPANPGVTVVTL